MLTYFVSYVHTGDGIWGFGDITLEVSCEINTTQDFITVKDEVKKANPGKEITILSIQLLGRRP